jgi:hypothetical protein
MTGRSSRTPRAIQALFEECSAFVMDFQRTEGRPPIFSVLDNDTACLRLRSPSSAVQIALASLAQRSLLRSSMIHRN